MSSRFALSALGLAVLLLFVALYWALPGVYFAILAAFDIPKAARPFSDLGAVLQAVHCAGRGVEVYAPNPCMGGGTYNYSALLLHVSALGGLAARLDGVGLGLALLFIAALALLPAPQSRAEFWLRAAGTASASTIFAVERMNLDVIILVLAIGGIWLVLQGGIAKLAGYGLFGIGAALKYYPIALLALLLRERPKRLVIIAAPLAGAGLVAAWRFRPQIAAALAAIPHGPPFGNCFGAIDIPLGFTLGLAALHGNDLRHLDSLQMPLALRGLYGAMLLFALWRGWKKAACYRPTLAMLPSAAQAYLTGGAALICACFFLAQNIDYRAIFLLLVLPASLALERRFALAIVALLWESLFRTIAIAAMPPLLGPVGGYSVVIMVWLARELLWWWVVTRLLAVLFSQAAACLNGPAWAMKAPCPISTNS
jgi:hypothetical protein